MARAKKKPPLRPKSVCRRPWCRIGSGRTSYQRIGVGHISNQFLQFRPERKMLITVAMRANIHFLLVQPSQFDATDIHSIVELYYLPEMVTSIT